MRLIYKTSISSRYKQIGNALPVNPAYHLGRCLIAMLDQRVDRQSMIVVGQAESKRNFQLSLSV